MDAGQSVEMLHIARAKGGQDGDYYRSKCASVTLYREDGQSLQVLHFVDRMVKVCEC